MCLIENSPKGLDLSIYDVGIIVILSECCCLEFLDKHACIVPHDPSSPRRHADATSLQVNLHDK